MLQTSRELGYSNRTKRFHTLHWLTYGRVGHNDHDVSVGCEEIDKSSKTRVPYFHALELCLQLTAMERGGGAGGGR